MVFLFPQQQDHIEKYTDDDRHSVGQNGKNWNEERFQDYVIDLEGSLPNDRESILDPNIFDPLYYLIKEHLGKTKEPFAVKAVKLLLSNCREYFYEMEVVQEHLHIEKRDILLGYLFLIFLAISKTTINKKDKLLVDEMNKHQGKNKGKIKGRGANSDDSFSLGLWQGYSNLLYDVCEFPWDTILTQREDNEFKRHLVHSIIRLQESPLIKEDEDKKQVFNTLETLVGYGIIEADYLGYRFCILLSDSEVYVAPVNKFLIECGKSNDQNVNKLLYEVLRRMRIFCLNKKYHMSENEGMSRIANVMIEISKKHPKAFLLMIGDWLYFYDSQFYTLRNMASEVVARVYMAVSKNSSEIDNSREYQAAAKDKEKYVRRLMERCDDINAHARSKSLELLSMIVRENLVDFQLACEIFDVVFIKILDQSVNVRKRALDLLNELLTSVENFVKALPNMTQLEKNYQDMKEVYDEICIKITAIQKQKVLEQRNREQEEDEEANNYKCNMNPEELQQNVHEDYDFGDEDLQADISRKKTQVKFMQVIEIIRKLYGNLEEMLEKSMQMFLNSKNILETQAAIQILPHQHRMNIKGFDEIFKKALKLVFNENVKNDVINVFTKINIDNYAGTRAIESLCKYYIEGSYTEKICQMEIVKILFANGKQKDQKEEAEKQQYGEYQKRAPKNVNMLHNTIIPTCWVEFLNKIGERDPDEQEVARACLKIMKIGVQYYPGWISKNIKEVFEFMRCWMNAERYDYDVIAELCEVCQYLDPKSEEDAQDIDLFCKVATYFICKKQGTDDPHWYNASLSLIKLIFKVKKRPETVAQNLLKNLSSFITNTDQISSRSLFGNDDTNERFLGTQSKGVQSQINDFDANIDQYFENKLSQVMFVAGEIAIKLLGEADKIEVYLRNKSNTAKDMGAEDELEEAAGGKEALYEQQKGTLNELTEKMMIGTFDQKKNVMKEPFNMLGGFLPICLETCKRIYADVKSDSVRVKSSTLTRVTMQTLCKFMAVSPTLLEEEINYLFWLILPLVDPVIKNNVIISIGDLVHKHNHIIEQHSVKLYSCLKDKDANVRRTTFLVLAHLILNSALKIREELPDLVHMLFDEQEDIRTYAKLFFSEFHNNSKNTIANLLPGAISRLSMSAENGGVREEMFQKFARELLQYIDKDGMTSGLVDKQLSRLTGKAKIKENELEIRNTCYCIQLLAKSNGVLKKLNENFDKSLKDILHIEGVEQLLIQAIKNLRKKFTKKDSDLDTLEARIYGCTLEELPRIRPTRQGKRGVRGESVSTNGEGTNGMDIDVDYDEDSETGFEVNFFSIKNRKRQVRVIQ